MPHESLQVVPGATWTATNTGRHIQSHGAGIIRANDIFYLIGEDKTTGTFFRAINAYSSTNLVEWKFEGRLLCRAENGDLGPKRIVERPKVIYNKSTRAYVMYMHIDSPDYSDARVGIATCNSVVGKFEYKGSFRPLDCESRDIGLFQDDDGAAYLLTEDRNKGLKILSLSEDYLNVVAEVYCWKECIESPAIWKNDGYYYMFGSQLTGWDCNDNVYCYAPSVAGPWSPWQGFADPGSKTYQSQTTTILPFGETAIYMGDRWCPSNLAQSTYIWLPLDKTGHDIYMKNCTSWTIDPSTQKWRHVSEEAQHLHNGHIRDEAFSCKLSTPFCIRTTIRIRYTNTSPDSRQITATLNGETYVIDLLPTETCGQGLRVGGETVLHCTLVSGDNNTISIMNIPDTVQILGITTSHPVQGKAQEKSSKSVLELLMSRFVHTHNSFKFMRGIVGSSSK